MIHCRLLNKCICLLLAASIACSFSGCTGVNTGKDAGSSKPEGSGVSVQSQTGQSLLLPDCSKWDGSAWKGLTVKLMAVGLSSDAPISSVIGNHAEIISQENVTIDKNTPAILLLVDRTQTAAEEETMGSATHTSEYWLIRSQLRPYPGRQDMKLADVLLATFDTSSSEARGNLLQLANGWKIN